MFVLRNKSLFFTFSALVLSAAIALIFIFGLNPSIDFAGGTVYEVEYTDGTRPAVATISPKIQDIVPGSVVQGTGVSGILIKTLTINDEQKIAIDNILGAGEREYEELRFKQFSPVISDELKNKSLFAIALVVLVIVAFIAYTFSAVSKPVPSYKYGLVAIVALLHDTIIPIGIFALLGSVFIDYQIDVLFVTAILATLGYSVNDTIVVFDRVRENLKKAHDNKQPYRGDAFAQIVGTSLQQTFMRSLYTSLTTLFALALLYFVGGVATQPFALVLGFGVIAGTYSSLFLACPLLVALEKFEKEDNNSNAEAAEIVVDESLPADVRAFLAKQKKTNS